MTEKLLLFFIIFSASLFNNLIVTYIIYYRRYGFFKKRPARHIGVNGWGIVMDGILAGCMNLVAINFLYEIRPNVTAADLFTAFVVAFVASVFCHILMAVRKWRIWIMPKPWHWNEAGYWHMFSMTAQFFFLAYPLILLFKNNSLLYSPITKTSGLLFFILLVLFSSALYCYDNKKELSIGKFGIRSRPW